jgi:TatD DNase family protein
MNQFIDIHTHTLRKSSEIISIYNYPINEVNSLELNEKKTEVNFSIGIHPWHIDPLNYYSQLKNVEKQLVESNAVFLGECGLDKLKCSDFNLQRTVFQHQINMAMKYQKPMILHCVKAFDEVLAMLKNKVAPDKVIFHGFHKSPEMAFDLTSKGYFISLGKSLFLQSERMKTVFEKVNPGKIFFETDDSEYSIEEVYQKASEISGKSSEFWKQKVFENFERIKLNGMKEY